MAEIDEDGSLFLTNTEIHVLETAFFQFEKSLDDANDPDLRTKLLRLKWDHLLLEERLKVLERNPANQSSPLDPNRLSE